MRHAVRSSPLLALLALAACATPTSTPTATPTPTPPAAPTSDATVLIPVTGMT